MALTQRSRHKQLTFQLCHGAQENVTLSLFILDRTKDLLDHSLGELSLLALLQLLFIANPAVQYSLDLRRDGDLLLLDESLSFKLCGFLHVKGERG